MVGIPANQIADVIPGVLSAGGTGAALNGLLLSTNTNELFSPTPITFPSAAAVGAYFGPASGEAAFAAPYFQGPDNSAIKPSTLLIALYSPGGNYAAVVGGGFATTLVQFQSITSATFSVTDNGAVKTTAAMSFAGATSFASVASIITTALTAAGSQTFVYYDSIRNAFVLRPTTAQTDVLGYPSGTSSLAAAMALTQAAGAVIYAPTPARTPATIMNAIVAATQNWATFTNLTEASTADSLALAAWDNAQGNRYAYVLWDTDPTPAGVNDTTSAGYQITQVQNYSGTFPVWNTIGLAALAMGYAASIDFDRYNGRLNAAFRSQSGLAATVTDALTAANLAASGYNFYGQYATANPSFTFLYPGTISGPFKWFDSYLNQIWLNTEFQVDLMTLLTSVGNVPYDDAGYAMIQTACQDTVNQGIRNGVIRQGVTLSSLQAAEVNETAGAAIDTVLSTQGYAFVITDPGAPARAARTSPACTFFYTDGGSIQQINLASVEIQ